jgi:lambda family phage minor tail protein L
MYTLDSTFKSEKNKSANRPIYLYTIHSYNGTTDLNLAEYDTDITYNGVTYSRAPIKHDVISENSSAEIDVVKVSISNVNRIVQGYLETYDLRGKKVTIKIVWANQLADTDAYIDFIYYIDTYTTTEEVVDFSLSSKFDILDVMLPFGKFSRTICRWKFKSTECGYAGAETTCDKRKTTCDVTMNNVARYGGFPSIPTNRIYV